jgi:hypothetical protein
MNRPTGTPTTAADGNAAPLNAAGDHAKGRFRCTGCLYATTVCRALPACPRCGGVQWEAVSWRPFARATTSTWT